MEYKKCPAIKKQKANYSPINPDVVVCDLNSCPYNKGEEIYWEGEETLICDGKIKRDLTDKINSD